MVESSPPGFPARAVGEIATRELLSCPPGTPVAEAARRMAQTQHGSIIVVERGQAIGIWTERDALSVDFADPAAFERPIREVMASPVRTIRADATVSEAGIAFRDAQVRHLLVVDADGAPAGMISQT
ncbi:MAG TPA: CBS domain-containing protein, partial [Azospirillum sp.]